DLVSRQRDHLVRGDLDESGPRGHHERLVRQLSGQVTPVREYQLAGPRRRAHQTHEHPGPDHPHGCAPPTSTRPRPPRSTTISPFTSAPSAAAKLPLFRLPVRMPCGRISTRPVALRLPRTFPPTTMFEALISASTSARSPTTTRPFTLMIPSN